MAASQRPTSPSQDTRKVGSLYVQVLSGGTWDVPAPGLLLFCERDGACSYLFNCAEGTQRFCSEHKLRLAGKLRRVFLTRLTWDTVGGLPGLLLTMRDAGHRGLQVHGQRLTSQLLGSLHSGVRYARPRPAHPPLRNGRNPGEL